MMDAKELILSLKGERIEAKPLTRDQMASGSSNQQCCDCCDCADCSCDCKC